MFGIGGKMKNPFEKGKADALANKYDNPYPEFSYKWGFYNKGWNMTKYPGLFK